MNPQAKTNRLIQEKSPYLLQHAANPVDWYPWGEEAFIRAREENKPIFLSIGYSTCHWCHVMEKESFEDEKTAELMNKDFISIKVDREERPDIDHVYMQAVMAMSGSGGWPMSVFLTPDREPFYGGTYFPPKDMHGRPGFPTLLNAISQKWKSSKDEILKSGAEISEAIRREVSRMSGIKDISGEEILKKTFEQYLGQFDEVNGGFGGAPKFPRSHVLSYLLRYWKRSGEPRALDRVTRTLDAMARGGIWDHLGGGFHRYSTDEEWHVPHFEKMLYDQALLAIAYTEGFQASGNPEYAGVVQGIFRYVLRDMKDSMGGFYSAEDADSHSEEDPAGRKAEGAFYVWSKKEIEEILGEESRLFFDFYDVHSGGNAAHDPHGEFTGKNILREIKTAAELSEKYRKSEEDVRRVLEDMRTRLFNQRFKRPRPSLDDKVLTDWNGLMIAALAYGARVLCQNEYADAAKKSADFILKNLKQKDGRLLHRWRQGEAAIPAFLEDYAFLSWGLFELYETTYDILYLKEAVSLINEMIRLFWDEESGGFYFTAKDSEKLYTRAKEIYDGAIPSGNSVAAGVLLRLGRLTMNPEFEKKAGEVFKTFSGRLADFPSGYPQMMMAFDFMLGPSREIVIAAQDGVRETAEMIEAVNRSFYPNQVTAFRPTEEEKIKSVLAVLPYLENQKMIQNKPTVYICKNFKCDLPLNSVKDVSERLR